jgi:ectoine hydroxylase-related dioxygenase (phytanoyl-CoA dioxygenase family)
MNMKADNLAKLRSDRVWLASDSCRVEDFAALVERTTSPADYPFAAEIQKNVPIYEGAAIRALVSDPDQRRALLAEWVEAMTDGPGVIALRGAFDDTAPVDAVTAAFKAMIAEERAGGVGGGDHFAKPGANDRVWNALEKLCLRDPEAFAAYYGNDIIALVSEAWLGPCYQVTSQLNSVNPGGAAQSAHRDYHLGFQTPAVIERYPVHVHRISPVLTLQGAVAHCDMPLESGPTLYLPYSQTYLPGYLAMGRPEFQA